MANGCFVETAEGPNDDRCMRAIVLTELPNPRAVWWEKYLRPYVDGKKIIVNIESMPDVDASLLSVSTLILLFRLTVGYLWRYRGYDFIITFQSNLTTACIGILKRIIQFLLIDYVEWFLLR